MRCVAAEPPTSSAKTTSCPPSTPPSRSSDRGDLCRAAVVEHRVASRQPPAASLGPDDRPREETFREPPQRLVDPPSSDTGAAPCDGGSPFVAKTALARTDLVALLGKP